MNEVLLSARKIYKAYDQGSQKLEILKGLDLEVQRGEAICIQGASGAGKSTFLHLLGTLDRPTDGQIWYEGKELSRLQDRELALFRNQKLGFVFQFHHLLPEFTAEENVMMPARIAKMGTVEMHARARSLLEELGLSHRRTHYPSELSGGEKQRVAIARALINRPSMLLADEPTGNLDTANGQRLQELLFSLQKQYDLTMIVVTHDENFAAAFPRTLKMADGFWVF